MYWDVTRARPVGQRRIEVVFADGRKGTVDIGHYIAKGGVYAALVDKELFGQFRVDSEAGVLCWPGGIDIAPEELYSRATGDALPAWMEPGSPEGDAYPLPAPTPAVMVREDRPRPRRRRRSSGS
jgi:hypothetical protein